MSAKFIKDSSTKDLKFLEENKKIKHNFAKLVLTNLTSRDVQRFYVTEGKYVIEYGRDLEHLIAESYNLGYILGDYKAPKDRIYNSCDIREDFEKVVIPLTPFRSAPGLRDCIVYYDTLTDEWVATIITKRRKIDFKDIESDFNYFVNSKEKDIFWLCPGFRIKYVQDGNFTYALLSFFIVTKYKSEGVSNLNYSYKTMLAKECVKAYNKFIIQ